jgi:hypothetical protein
MRLLPFFYLELVMLGRLCVYSDILQANIYAGCKAGILKAGSRLSFKDKTN